MLLSVIIPVHNTAGYIADCVNSIIKQGLRATEFEVMLVENGSTDASLQECRSLQAKYPAFRIKVLSTSVSGVGNARNEGLRAAVGRYVHFVDSDDYLGDGMYDDFKNIALRNDADVLVSGIVNDYVCKHKQIIEADTVTAFYATRNCIISFMDKLDAERKVWALNVIWNKWYKRSMIVDNNIEYRTDIHLGEDFVFNCQVFKLIQSLYVSSYSYYHYMKRDRVSLVNNFNNDVLFRRRMIYNSTLELFSSFGLLEAHKRNIDNLEGKLLFNSLSSIFSKTCKLSLSDKRRFIREILHSEFFAISMNYLKQSSHMFHKFALLAIKSKNLFAVYSLLWIKNIMLKIRE